MPLHDCTHTFQQLATEVLPADMDRMRDAMGTPWSMAQFAGANVGPKTLAKEFGMTDDFPGCYVFIDEGVPIYVGISRYVLSRLRQHVFGKTHYDASLAYKMARENFGQAVPKGTTRKESMKHIGTHFTQAKSDLAKMHVATITITNALERYVFEPYCAAELDTRKWNSFNTH